VRQPNENAKVPEDYVKIKVTDEKDINEKTKKPGEKEVWAKAVTGKIASQSAIEVSLLNKDTGKIVKIRRKDIVKIELAADILAEREKRRKLKEAGWFNIGKFVDKYHPRAGLLGGLVVPVGDLSSVMAPGFGVDIFGDALLPFDIIRGLELRTGFAFGFDRLASAQSGYSATLTMFTVSANCEASYQAGTLKDLGIRPYVSIGFGGVYNSLSGEGDVKTNSSFDFSVPVHAGGGYVFKKIPKVEFILDIGYLVSFETVTGMFLSVKAGAVYHFYGSWGSKDGEYNELSL